MDGVALGFVNWTDKIMKYGRSTSRPRDMGGEIGKY